MALYKYVYDMIWKSRPQSAKYKLWCSSYWLQSQIFVDFEILAYPTCIRRSSWGGGSRRNIVMPFATEKLEWLEDMFFFRFDRIHERDGRMDRQTDRQMDGHIDTTWRLRPRLMLASRGRKAALRTALLPSVWPPVPSRFATWVKCRNIVHDMRPMPPVMPF